MEIFRQDQFIQGLSTDRASTKAGNGFYQLLINGRVRHNEVESIRGPVAFQIPPGKVQGLYAHDKWLLVFVNGIAYYRDVTATATGWARFNGFAPMSASVDTIYALAIPVSTSYYRPASGEEDPMDPSVVMDFGINQNSGCLLICDGVNQPQKILPDGTALRCQDFEDWETEYPEYVPIGIMPTLSGGKLYLLSPDGTQIYHSVSGRYLDFVIQRTSTGEAGGRADMTAQSVSYRPITAMLPAGEGAVILSTDEATFALMPDYNFLLFAEPYLHSELLFSSGALNSQSLVDILGDIAYISSSGIHSFNFVSQLKSESNNVPLTAAVENILRQPQDKTACAVFDSYAFFAVNTIYGYGCLVLDRNTKTFVSLDLTFGRAKQFAVTKNEGARRLFYITHDNELFEAFAGEPELCQVYLGDFSANTPTTTHRVNSMHATFVDIVESASVQVTAYADGRKTAEFARTIESEAIVIADPQPLPFSDARNTKTVDCDIGRAVDCYKSGFFIEWTGAAKLTSLSVHGAVNEGNKVQMQSTRVEPVHETYIVTSDHNYDQFIGHYPTMVKVTTTIGKTYVVVGSVSFGDRVRENHYWTATRNYAYVAGYLYDVTNFYSLYERYTNIAQTTAFFVAGDFFMANGTAQDVARHRIFWDRFKAQLYAAPGNHDLQTNNGREFFTYFGRARYYAKRFGLVEAFFVNSGLDNAKVLVESDGNTYSSRQGQRIKEWIKRSTARFKVVVFHHPPYMDNVVGSGHEATGDLRWPIFREVDLVLNGHQHSYQRGLFGQTQYVIAAGSGRPQYTAIKNTMDFVHNGPSYLKLDVTTNALIGRAYNASNSIIDEFAINK